MREEKATKYFSQLVPLLNLYDPLRVIVKTAGARSALVPGEPRGRVPRGQLSLTRAENNVIL